MRFFAPDAALTPYVSAIYLNDIETGAGPRMADMLHPEWANLRFIEGDAGVASIGPGEMRPVPSCVLVGPTCHATHFETGTIRSWGIGLLPLGWAKFIGAPAVDFADRFVDAEADPALAALTAMRPLLRDPDADPHDQAAVINRTLLGLLDTAPADDHAITRAHAALSDPDLATVAELAGRAGISLRSLDRLSRRAFGFTPKLLLRRQRFLRTLGEALLDPNARWLGSLDLQYHDQSHFNRDFCRFMGLPPGAYMARPRPILDAAVRGRMAAAGAPMQVLHRLDVQR
ncbi:AraC family transcriptional regulator [Sphingomonas sp. AOB5]|uniref:helix-turn-helix domain-containing protein n=1 Tax=Sphingomonas sp. AOB5 TaxID=3034017 RepID=UPI0023F6E0EA|nr:AraC family transcriptional regulator [Sphingomonas sp. AOB5]MDF7777007.1 AraC family transcriptional regulator [Sphingomonas sp. AOB5]